MATPTPARYVAELRRRIRPQLLFFVLIWPLLSIALAVMMLREQPMVSSVAVLAATIATSISAARMIPELLATGVLAALAGCVFFAAAHRLLRSEVNRMTLWIEPPAMLLAITTGFALQYPALLRHPMLMSLRGVQVMAALAIVATLALLFGTVARSRRAFAAHALGVAMIVSIAWLIAIAPAGRTKRPAPRDSVFLVGLDSLSQSDPLAPLRKTVANAGGAWYENPVTPGLITNAVWTSILQHRHVHETGVFLTLQRPDWRRSPYQLVREAKRRNFETWSFFSDQFTCYAGSIAGFDVDRSGPKGWLQLATATLKEAHILGPVLLPRLPRLPFAQTPPNQSGTYAYSLATELRDLFTAGHRDERIFVAGHLDYLHQAAYPALTDLTADERARVLRSKVASVADLSLHWQYPELEGEPLGIYRWKIARLQQEIDRAIRDTGVADPARRNRIAILSDHGSRKNLELRNFARRQYYKVLLATIGIPHRDTRMPIALLDIPNLLGWPDPSRPGPADLVVEYTNVKVSEHAAVFGAAEMKLDGEVRIDPRITTFLGKRLLAYWPHRGSREYVPVAVVPAEVGMQKR
ncbi:MAG TPA: hypothetical protein VF846_08590 [Thermoanaerobaculia bacterium]